MSPRQPQADDEDAPSGPPRRTEFDCPVCNANNPYGDGFGPGDEIRCFYCGQEFQVAVTYEGKWRFREI